MALILKSLLGGLLTVTSLATGGAAFATDSIAVQAKIALNEDGSSSFSWTYDDELTIGVVAMTLNYETFDATIESGGFDISHAVHAAITTPTLPAGCSIQSYTGQLGSSAASKGDVSLVLLGSSCKDAFNRQAPTLPIEMSFDAVPALVAGRPPVARIDVTISN